MASLRERLKTLNTRFYLTLDRYQQAFIENSSENTSASKNNLAQAEGQLNLIFTDLAILKSDVQISVSENRAVISQGNNKIDEAKDEWINSKEKLEDIYSSNKAAKPLKLDMNSRSSSSMLTSIFYLISFIGLVMLIKKQFKKTITPIAQAIPVVNANKITV